MTAQLLLALVMAHAIHSLGESTNVQAKLTRLKLASEGKKLKPYPMNIDTRAKSYAFGTIAVIVATALSYGLLSLLDLETDNMLSAAFVLIVVVEVLNTIKFDKYHVAIERLIKQFSKKK